MTTRRMTAIAAGTIAVAFTSGIAQAQPRIEVGVLTCHGGEVSRFVFGSEHRLDCVFRNKIGGARQHYTGAIHRFGLDVGIVQRSRLVWSVFAPTRALGQGALAGTYLGATAGGTIGVGASANVLVGGSNRAIALQPLSIEAQTGLNIVVGFADLQLRPR